MFRYLRKVVMIEITVRTKFLGKFISIYRFYGDFDSFYILKENMTEFMIKFIDIGYVLKCYVYVVDAGRNSGTRSTVEKGREYGREVYIV